MYDCTRRETFESVRDWAKDVEMHASPDVTKLLLGNKTDLGE